MKWGADVPVRRVLCVFPVHTGGFVNYSHAFRFFPEVKALMPPQGILTIAAYLPRQWQVRFVDENVRPASEQDYRWADVVMVSGMHSQRRLLNRIASRARRCGKLTVLGGPSVSASPENYPDFDILHLGELGDATNALIRRICLSVERPSVQERYTTVERLALDDLPLPAYHLIRPSNYIILSIQWSSGCPYTCEFCDIPALYGRNPRYKSPERLLRELDALAALDHMGGLFFVDDNLIGNKKAFKQLLPHIVEWQKRNKYPFHLVAECSVNVALDRELMALLREACFIEIFFGIESPDERALVEMDKRQNVRMPLGEALRVINSYGIAVNAGIILGLDSDDDRTVSRVTGFIDELQVNRPVINMLYAPPKTPLRQRLEAEGRIIPDEQVTDSNIRYKVPAEVVRKRWEDVIGHVYEPARVFQRFEYNLHNVYRNRVPMPPGRRPTRAMLRNGPIALLQALVRLGLLAPYRGHFLRVALSAVRSGQFDRLMDIAISAYHMIQYRDEVRAGGTQACGHTEAPGEVPMPKTAATGRRSPLLRAVG